MTFVERLQKEEITEDKNEMQSNAWEDNEVEDTRVTQALEVAPHHGDTDTAYYIVILTAN
jgi:hypothetical protein